MAVFRFKLKDDKTGESRFVSVSADSEAEAIATIERQEAKKVGFVLPAAEATSLEKRLKEGKLTGRDKAMLFAHQQDAPYKFEKGGKA
jgi:hypothetical protein